MGEHDEMVRDTVLAKNRLEQSTFSLKNQLEHDGKLGDGTLSEQDRDTLLEAVNEIIEWLDDNINAELDDYRERQQEFDDIVQPILKNYAENGAGHGFDEEYHDHEGL